VKFQLASFTRTSH